MSEENIDVCPESLVAQHNPNLERRLRQAGVGGLATDLPTRGRYATDASAYQVMPQAVAIPRSQDELRAALDVARSERVPVTLRGGGTSQCGQTVNDGLVIDVSRHLNRVLDFNVARRTCVVEPGIVLDDLNRALKPHGLWFPVDVSTASRATIGGMAGNNSCGGRSLRYGTMRDNVHRIDAILADGRMASFGPIAGDLSDLSANDDRRALFAKLLGIGAREKDEVHERFPAVQRRVGGYNLDALDASRSTINMAHILVGSEGTLGVSTAIELALWPVLGTKALGVCHFGSFHEAMDMAQHIVALKPIAVELVDRTMLELAASIPLFRPTLNAFLRGHPEALLLVEFADEAAVNAKSLKALEQLIGDRGFGWDRAGKHWGGVVSVNDPKLQTAITELRTSGLNIMMSMKDARKPVSFVEDCAVPLIHLADYTANLSAVFEKHATRGTWYAHASEGCLHVRPVLNLKLDTDLKTMRAVAEEAFALVRRYKGSHSGEHGDGIVRSEFHRAMFGDRIVAAFEEIKDTFDPTALLNPGRIVRPPRFDDRSLLRYNADYARSEHVPHLDWSAYPSGAQGFQGAVEMCNNNGACRKSTGGVMCPSFRVTRDERDVTRGRANHLRLALSSQLGADALTSDAMADSLSLCVSCKACKRECPTGVDMARMKIEVAAARMAKNGLSLRDKLIAYLPHYADRASRVPTLMNARDWLPGARRLSEKLLGIAAERPLPRWRFDIFDDSAAQSSMAPLPLEAPEVVLFCDTFNRTFERENLDAALAIFASAGWRVHLARPPEGEARPLCCGRTFLAVGHVAQARTEARRSLAALVPFAQRGIPIVGLEPSCIYTFRDEIPVLLPGPDAELVAAHTMGIEDLIARETASGRMQLALKPIAKRALLHGHCHQKAFDGMGAVERVLRLLPGLEVETIETSCCGMAGSFGYQVETVAISKAMAELSLLPAVRSADPNTRIVADGTSCRHQIAGGSRQSPQHVVRLLVDSLRPS